MKTVMFASCIFTVIAIVSSAYYGCVPCFGENCDVEPEGCLHGIVRDTCKRLICASGPGQSCGGPHGILGKCGKGLTCNCGRCSGCSIDRMLQGIVECEYIDPVCMS